MNDSRDGRHPRRIYRNSERGAILGVCTGLAEWLDAPVWLTRLGALALGWFFPVVTATTYLIAALVMPERPLRYCGDGDERSFWQSRRDRS